MKLTLLALLLIISVRGQESGQGSGQGSELGSGQTSGQASEQENGQGEESITAVDEDSNENTVVAVEEKHWESVKYKICPNTPSSGKVIDIQVSPCEKFVETRRGRTYETCILKRGEDSTMKVVFEPTAETEKLTIKLSGKVNFFWVPLVMADNNVCRIEDNSLTQRYPTCPLKADKQYTLEKSIDVKSVYPQMKVPISIELRDKDNNDVVCVIFPVMIQ